MKRKDVTMKWMWRGGLLSVLLLVAQVAAAQGVEKTVKVSEKKWLDDHKGYQEALELQKQTGADLLLYFAQYSPPDKRGLSTWFERKGLQHGRVVDALKPFIKVKVALPLDKKELPAFEKFRVSSGPVLYVVRTNGWPARITPFDWPGGEPTLKTPEVLIQEITAKSSLGARAESKPSEGP
jgi:hypothetical protein